MFSIIGLELGLIQLNKNRRFRTMKYYVTAVLSQTVCF